MTCAKNALLSATAAFVIAAFVVGLGTPAFALNPQPLPPGYQSHVNGNYTATGQSGVQMRKAGGGTRYYR